MDPTAWQTKPTLVGERVELRPFRAADLAAMAECPADPEVRKLTGSVHSTAGMRWWVWPRTRLRGSVWTWCTSTTSTWQ